jgi:hypothetical protein
MPKWLNPIIVLLTVFICGLFAYCLIFSGFIDYDDEGVFLMILHLMGRGKILYDQIITIYGPFAFFPRFFLLKLFAIAPTHDSGRMMTLVNWLLTSLFLGIAAWRQCRSAAYFALTTLFTCIVLNRIIHEPGHPQDQCCALLAIAIFLATFWTEKKAPAILAALAILGGLLLMTKVNLGVFYAAALAPAIALQFPKSPQRIALICLLLVALAAMPFILMSDNLSTPDVLCFAIVIALAPISCAIAALGQPGNRKWRDVLLAAIAFIAAALLTCVAPLAMGSSIHGLIDGIIRFPLFLSHKFAIASPMDPWSITVAAVGIVLAIAFSRSTKNDPLAAIVKIIVALAALACIALHAEEHLFRFGPGLAFLVLLPAARDRPFPRIFAAFLAISETLWAYPICGAQLSFAVFPYVFIAVCILSDGITELATSKSKSPNTILRAASIALLLIALAIGGINAQATYRLYTSLVPFGLPGTDRIRVEPEKAAAYQKITADLKRNTDFFTGLPVTNSLYVWTHIEPPPWAIHTLWMYTLTDAQQQEVIDSLQNHPRACLVYSEELLAFWLQGRSLPPGKLIDYLKANYSPAFTMAQIQGYRFQLCPRKDRQAPIDKGDQ